MVKLDDKERSEEEKELLKLAFREAAKEWLDSIMAAFGKWSLMTIAGGLVVALGYFLLTLNGWHK